MTDNLPEKQSKLNYNGRGVQLSSLEDAYRFSVAVCKSGLAPSSFNSPEKVLIAMQYGAELGLSPMQSLQSIAVINGRAALWGDALPALVHESGVCEYIREEQIGKRGEDSWGWRVTSKRKDQDYPNVSEFTVEDAKTAGLWGKGGPWKSYPSRMLKMRARAFNLRDNFADALRGFGVAEEQEDIVYHATSRPAFDPEAIPANSAADDDPLLTGAPDSELTDDEKAAIAEEEAAMAATEEQ